MSTTAKAPPPPPKAPVHATGLAAPPGTRGWLAGESVYDEKRHIGRTIYSLMASGGIQVLMVLIFLFATRPGPKVAPPPEPPKVDMVYIQNIQPPSLGGGGRPNPAPRAAEVPRAPDAKVAEVPLDPPPSISPNSSVDLLSALGPANVGLSSSGGAGFGSSGGGGGGGGGGTGSGYGNAYGPGNGVINPVPTFHPDPKYTSEAMRAKIQGVVILEGTVDKTGKLIDIKILQSLDKNFGLDEEAIRTAKLWIFKPGKLAATGEIVMVRVTMQLEFTLR